MNTLADWWSRETVVQKFNELTTKYPTLIKKEIVGKSHLGANVPLYRIGTNPTVKILYDGCIHGASSWSAHTCYNLAKWLLENQSEEAKSALRRLQTLIIPMLNYDRYGLSRKNANGVDLNRNFVSGWCTGSTDPSSDYYKGVSAGSEKETQFMRNLFSKEKPLVYVNFHTYGGDPVTMGEIRRVNYGDTSHRNNSLAILNKTVGLCIKRGVSPPKITYVYTSPNGYAVADAYALAKSYSFLWEQWHEMPTQADVDGTMTNRLICFQIAVDQLYGVEPPTPGEILSANIGATFGLIIIIPYITTYSREVIRQWKKQTSQS